MKLDRKEIFDTLKKLFKKKKDMKDWQMAALTDFLMRQGETSTEVDKGRFRANAKSAENFIDIEEWIDIFTEDKANWPALKRLIEHEYPDEESQERVMDLLELSVSRKQARRLRTLSNFGGITEEEREDEEGEETDGTPMSVRRPSEDIEANMRTPFLDVCRPSCRASPNSCVSCSRRCVLVLPIVARVWAERACDKDACFRFDEFLMCNLTVNCYVSIVLDSCFIRVRHSVTV